MIVLGILNLRNISRLWLLTGIILIGLVSFTAISAKLTSDFMLDMVSKEVKSIVEVAEGIADDLIALEQAGTLTREEVVYQFRTILNGMRYDNGEFLFLVDYDGNFVAMPPNNDLVGTNIINNQLPDGRMLTQEAIAVAKGGGGYLRYVFPKAGETELSEKMSYFTGIEEWEMYLGTGAYLDRVHEMYWTFLSTTLLISGIIIAVSGGISVWVGLSISRSFAYIMERVTVLATGGLQHKDCTFTPSPDVEELVQGFEQLTKALCEGDQAQKMTTVEREKSNQKRQEALLMMADDIESSFKSIVEGIAHSSDTLATLATQMKDAAENSTEKATVVSTAAGDASNNVNAVAASTEELSASVDEISGQVQRSNTVASDATDKSEQANAMVGSLASAVGRINDVVTLINDIASQTNLLALNATIEAARAGDAGKSFAVVASEVKSLADQTAKATEEIADQINSIQSETEKTVEAIQASSTTITTVNEITSVIASAVEEQGAATREISHSIQSAAQGTQEVSANINGVRQSADETKSASGSLFKSAADLASQSKELNANFVAMLSQIRESA